MKHATLAAAALLAAAAGLAGCGERDPAAPDAAVLGGSSADAPDAAASAAPADDSDLAIPPPTLPSGGRAGLARTGNGTAVAVWVQDGHVVAASFRRASGWSAPRPLEQIYGHASDARVAANGQGTAMALWRHTVGSVESLRYSRFDASAGGWSPPDVVPGALPRPQAPAAAGDADAPRLEMDAQGNVTARWPSGFDPAEEQVARYRAGEGWSPAGNERLAAAPAASAPAR